MIKKKKVLFTSAVWSLVASTFLCAEDIFDQESSTLHISRVVANDGLPDSNTFIGYDVIITIKSVEEVGDKYPVDLEQYPGMRNIKPDFYDTKSNTLYAPQVKVGDYYYDDVALKIDQVVSIGDVQERDPTEDSIIFDYVIHENIPSWYTENFYEIMNNLHDVLPFVATQLNYYIDVYVWAEGENLPFCHKYTSKLCRSGQSLSANRSDITGGTNVWMQLELRDAYLFGPNNYLHKYTVVAHESYHVYQRSFPDVPSKWLREGAAATFESLYSQEFLGEDYWYAQRKVNLTYISNPEILEKDDTMDSNYSSSVFMILILASELQKQGISETEAFKLILKDFWEREPGINWKPVFEELFKMSVERFYEIVSDYQADLAGASLADDVKDQIIRERFFSLTPSTNLKLSEIFGSGN
tara:strand:- start:526 stop:1764 length:1239 start_codon:yes stop_codon:yes gene_type:complete